MAANDALGAGIGLRTAHYLDMLEHRPRIGWLEIHGENYFCAGGQPLRVLEALRCDHALSVHCVGLSLGRVDAMDRGHLQKLKALVDRFDPIFVSDHLSWGVVDGHYFNDLLPLPYTEEALEVVCRNIEAVQEFLGRRMLIENISAYLRYAHSTIAEWDFLAALTRRTGCGILLDVNNIHVNAVNHGFDAVDYLAHIPPAAVEEMHLAGFETGETCLVDTHSRPVSDEVWKLYAEAIRRLGPRPTLIEWDADVPPLDVLLAEAARADSVMETAQYASLAA